MKVKVKKARHETVGIEIMFQIYRLHEHGDEWCWQHFYRVQSDGSYDEITKKSDYLSDDYAWEVERGHIELDGTEFDSDFYAGCGGSYVVVTQSEFDAVAAELKAFILKIAP